GRVAAAEGWTPDRVAGKTPTGKREGWWGMSANGDAFLEELLTWRELSYNTAFYVDRHDAFESLPPWAQTTLAQHAGDPRAEIFSLEELEAGATYDALWNATQGQLREDGRIHNYLRILWGKKFLEWTPRPEDALAAMLAINNRWALDGRNPNSTSGITWVMGRYDRPWGPERPVIGKVRPMSSEATARKVNVTRYIERYTALLPARAETERPRDKGASKGAGTSGEDVLPPT
ncbi:MAG: Deoxyribodipyrimidine photolyase, type II, partial [uncultured Gemmatimonadaceae bacterium]